MHAYSAEVRESSQVVSECMGALRSMFPKAKIPDPVHTFVSGWMKDIYSCGSHSYLKRGCSAAAYDNLAEPAHNLLFFAGEATCKRYPSTAHGALLSGRREAVRIALTFAKSRGILQTI